MSGVFNFFERRKFKKLAVDYGSYIEFNVPFGNILMIQKGFSDKPLNWWEANEYAKNLNLGGYNDWTIPTKEELWIMYKIQDVYGFKASDEFFWSSTLAPYSFENKDISFFDMSFQINDKEAQLPLGGIPFSARVTNSRNLRCVRVTEEGKQERLQEKLAFVSIFLKDIGWTSAQELSDNFIDCGNYIKFRKPIGTIRMIQKNIGNIENRMEWNKAMEYAKSLNLGGYSDWRLPTKDESEIIYKIRHICGIHYPYDEISFWSSETSGDGRAYTIRLNNGVFTLEEKYLWNDVCCVR